MKIWIGFESEHSASLVMVGTFATDSDAEAAERLLHEIDEQVRRDLAADAMDAGEPTDTFTAGMLETLRSLELYELSPNDPDQFAYDFSLERLGRTITLRTDELDVGAFLKLMISRGATVEVYSQHDRNADPDGAE